MVEKLEPPELKSCPFCTGKANLDHENNLAYVFCGSCGTTSPICMSDGDAIAVWNRRDPNAITLDLGDEELVQRLMHDGCKASSIHLSCAYPNCTCHHIPNSVKAVIAEIMKGGGDE